MSFKGESGFTPFRIIRQQQQEWESDLKKEIDRQKGRRRRWDIPIGEIINNGSKPQTKNTNMEILPLLRRIINHRP